MEIAKLSGIYGLVDPNTGHLRYIGLSKNIHKRFKDHLKIQRFRKIKATTHLYNWLRSLDKQPELIIIELTDNLAESEQFYISYFKSLGCNLVNGTSGGDGVSGYIFSQEQKKMISIKTKEGMARLSPEQYVKIAVNKGKMLNAKKIVDNFGTVYNSLKEASQILGTCISNISLNLRGHTKIVKGKYNFRYL